MPGLMIFADSADLPTTIYPSVGHWQEEVDVEKGSRGYTLQGCQVVGAMLIVPVNISTMQGGGRDGAT